MPKHEDLTDPGRRALVRLTAEAAPATLGAASERESAPNPLPRRARLGPCRLLGRLGAGATGTVYRAELVEERPYGRPGDVVAVKVLHPEALVRASASRRFLREAGVGQKVRHPGVVHTHEVGLARRAGVRLHFLIMEYIEGITLQQLFAQLDTVPEPLLRDLAGHTARGLAAIHAAGAVHRDVKPSNLILTRDQQVKLMDLGAAHLPDSDEHITASGHFVGTPLYSAPEQLGGAPLGPAADLYALGVVLYEGATGSPHSAGKGVADLLLDRLQRDAPPASARNPNLSPFLDQLIARLLRRKPSDRFASAHELALVLEAGERSAWWHERVEQLGQRPTLRPLPVTRETPVVGRDDELGLLRSLLDEARAGQGRLVILEGEAGAGKTRMLDELVRELAARQEPLHFLYGSNAVAGAAGALAQAAVEHLDPTRLEMELRRRLPETARLAAAFAAYLGRRSAPAGSESLTRDAVEALFCGLARALGAEHPVLWIAEDVHFADADELARLTALGRIAHGERLLVIATTRPEAEDRLDLLTKVPGALRISLRGLSKPELVQLLGELPGTLPVVKDLAARIAGAAAGNPFVALELARSLCEPALAARPGNASCPPASGLTGLPLPSSVSELLRARLAGLGRFEREVLEAGAVQGFAFDADLVARVLGRERLEVLQALAALQRRAGVVRAHGAAFEFEHHLLRDVIYLDLPPERRREGHRLLAGAFARQRTAGSADQGLGGEEAVFLSEHLLRAGQAVAPATLDRALDHLAAMHANQPLLDLTAMALESLAPGGGERWCTIALRRAKSLEFVGRWDAQRALVEEVIARTDAGGLTRLAASAREALGFALYQKGELPQARQVLLAAEALLGGQPQDEVAASVAGALGHVLNYLGDVDGAGERYRRQADLALSLDDPRQQALAAINLGLLHLDRGQGESARRVLEQAVESCQSRGLLKHELGSLGNLCFAHRVYGTNEEARDTAERMRTLARQVGNRMLEAQAHGLLGSTYRSLGRYDAARRHFERQLALAGDLGAGRHEMVALANMGRLATDEGDLEVAEGLLERALALSRSSGWRQFDGWALYALAQLARGRGDDAVAVERSRAALEVEQPLGSLPETAKYKLALGRALFESGDLAAARPLLVEADRLVRDLRVTSLGLLPAAYLARLGDLDLQGQAIPERAPLGVRAETHLVLHLATGAGHHRDEAQHLLEQMSSHLSGARLEAFWRNNPTARSVRKLNPVSGPPRGGDPAPETSAPADGGIRRRPPARNR